MIAPTTPPDSVRLALPSEAQAIAEIQRRTWAASSNDALRAVLLDQWDLESMASAWHAAITRPPEARFRVLVAVNPQVVGFATTRPSDDEDADPVRDGVVEEFAIDPAAQRAGHGSRLLHACVDTLRADGFTLAHCWVPTEADGTRVFLTAAGWAPDGAHREIGTDDEQVRLKQVRLHTDISPD